MIKFFLVSLCFVLVLVTDAVRVQLHTRQGIIYGTQTSVSEEYLGYEMNSMEWNHSSMPS